MVVEGVIGYAHEPSEIRVSTCAMASEPSATTGMPGYRGAVIERSLSVRLACGHGRTAQPTRPTGPVRRLPDEQGRAICRSSEASHDVLPPIDGAHPRSPSTGIRFADPSGQRARHHADDPDSGAGHLSVGPMVIVLVGRAPTAADALLT